MSNLGDVLRGNTLRLVITLEALGIDEKYSPVKVPSGVTIEFTDASRALLSQGAAVEGEETGEYYYDLVVPPSTALGEGRLKLMSSLTGKPFVGVHKLMVTDG